MNESFEKNVKQRLFWQNEFGDEYINRNKSVKEINQLYQQQTGVTKEEIFQKFFGQLDRTKNILELGCNVGLNLVMLRNLGFQNLTGVELNEKAFRIAKEQNPKFTFYNDSIENFVPKGDNYDLVFTSGVLIHINPLALNDIIKKILNLTKEYIFGFEYYSDKLVEINYRGHSNVCWKQNFPRLLKQIIPLKTIKEEKIFYTNQNLCDITYLLQTPQES